MVIHCQYHLSNAAMEHCILRKCILCNDKVFPEEKIKAEDYGYKGKDLPLCSTCEKDPYKYIHAIVYAKAYWHVKKE